MSLSLPIPKELVEELEECKRRYSRRPYLSPLQKAQLINKIASIFNKYWSEILKPFLGGSIWGNSMRFFQDIISDEFKREERAGSRWIIGLLTTEDFIKHVNFFVEQLIKGN
jgi:hypothetical protein